MFYRDRNNKLRQDDNEGSDCVQIVGTKQEIEWAKTALLNNCEACPYLETCNRKAREESEQCGQVRFSCKEYLKQEIAFVVENKVQKNEF